MPKLLKVRKRNAPRLSKKPAKTQRSKTPSSSIPQNPRRVSAPSKSSVKKSNAQLKAEIENLLGEDFETLADAQKALKKESTPVEKLPNKFFKIKKLTKKTHKNLAEVLDEIEVNPNKIDGLKDPEEYWGLRMFGNRSYEVFSNIDLLAQRIREYKSFEATGKGHGKKAAEYLDNVYLIKYEGSPANWSETKREEKAEREAKYKKKRTREAKQLKSLKKEVKELRKQVKSKGSKVGISRTKKGK